MCNHKMFKLTVLNFVNAIAHYQDHTLIHNSRLESPFDAFKSFTKYLLDPLMNFSSTNIYCNSEICTKSNIAD